MIAIRRARSCDDGDGEVSERAELKIVDDEDLMLGVVVVLLLHSELLMLCSAAAAWEQAGRA